MSGDAPRPPFGGQDEQCGGVLYVRDARRLSADGLEDLRRCAVAAVESGVPRAEVARLYGISRQAVGAWVSTYRRVGADALRPRRRGRRPGDRLALSVTQQLWTVRTLTASKPDEVGLDDELWTCASLAALVGRQFGIELGAVTMRNYLTRWGFRPGPGSGRHPDGVHLPVAGPHTDVTDGPRIRSGPSGERAKRPADRSETLWTDCARIRWSVPRAGRRDGSDVDAALDGDVLFAVSGRGAVLFMATPDPHDGAEVRDFFSRLVRQRGRRLTLVPGRWPSRRADLLDAWIGANTERVRVPR